MKRTHRTLIFHDVEHLPWVGTEMVTNNAQAKQEWWVLNNKIYLFNYRNNMQFNRDNVP